MPAHQMRRLQIVAPGEEIENLQMLAALHRNALRVQLEPVLRQPPQLIGALQRMKEHRIAGHLDDALMEFHAGCSHRCQRQPVEFARGQSLLRPAQRRGDRPVEPKARLEQGRRLDDRAETVDVLESLGRLGDLTQFPAIARLRLCPAFARGAGQEILGLRARQVVAIPDRLLGLLGADPVLELIFRQFVIGVALALTDRLQPRPARFSSRARQHEETAISALLDDALVQENGQRLADRRARNLEAFGQSFRRQMRARAEFSHADARDDVIGDAQSERAAGHV